MIGERIKILRNDKKLSLEELGKQVNRTASTLSRYENNQITKWDPDFLKELAKALHTTSAYLLGITDDSECAYDDLVQEYTKNGALTNIIVPNEEMSPELPQGAIVKIRPLKRNEKLQEGSFYYVEFQNKKCFRMVIDDEMDGLGFIPNDISERRIAFDPDYVTIHGKAVSMQVVFEDEVEYK